MVTFAIVSDVPIMTSVNFAAVAKSISKKQRELIAALPENLRTLPKYRLVQLGHIPSRAQLAADIYRIYPDAA